MRDPVRNYARLAASRSGENEERAFGCGNGFTLLRVETFQEIHYVGGRTV